MLKPSEEKVKGEEEVKDLRGRRWYSHQEGRFELERLREPVSWMKPQYCWQVGSPARGGVAGVGEKVVQLEGMPNQRLNQSKVWRLEKWSECSCDPQRVECRAREASFDKVSAELCVLVPPGEGVTRGWSGEQAAWNPDCCGINDEGGRQLRSKNTAVPAQRSRGFVEVINEFGKNMD